MQFGSGLNKTLGLLLLTGVAVSISSPAEAGNLLDWWLGLIGQQQPVRVPEPATLALFATGIAGVGLMRRRRRKHD